MPVYENLWDVEKRLAELRRERAEQPKAAVHCGNCTPEDCKCRN